MQNYYSVSANSLNSVVQYIQFINAQELTDQSTEVLGAAHAQVYTAEIPWIIRSAAEKVHRTNRKTYSFPKDGVRSEIISYLTVTKTMRNLAKVQTCWKTRLDRFAGVMRIHPELIFGLLSSAENSHLPVFALSISIQSNAAYCSNCVSVFVDYWTFA